MRWISILNAIAAYDDAVHLVTIGILKGSMEPAEGEPLLAAAREALIAKLVQAERPVDYEAAALAYAGTRYATADPSVPCPDGDACPDARRYGSVHPTPEPAGEREAHDAMYAARLALGSYVKRCAEERTLDFDKYVRLLDQYVSLARSRPVWTEEKLLPIVKAEIRLHFFDPDEEGNSTMTKLFNRGCESLAAAILRGMK